MRVKSRLLFIILLLIINNVYSGMCSNEDDFDGITCRASVYSFFGPSLVLTSIPMGLSQEASNKDDSTNIIDAKLDAIAYLAADGEVYHTARLEKAFAILRVRYPNSTGIELSKVIVNY